MASFTHAIEVLTERKMELRALIRTCYENSDRIMTGIRTSHYEAMIVEIDAALALVEREGE